MNRDMEWNTELTKIQHTNYVRNSRAITVAWFVFSVCYTILNIVAFIQPFWFGDTDESPGVGYFGLYEYCERRQTEYVCHGNFLDFNSLVNDVFRASAFLVGAAALLFIFSIICMILFMFLKARIVLRVCGWLQLIAAAFMLIACVIYPIGFDDPVVKGICGQQSEAFIMDKCQIRWAYILAIVLIFDAFILAALAFVLAARQAREIPEFKRLKEDKSRTNRGFTGSNIITASSSPQKASLSHPVRKRHSYNHIDLPTSNTENNEFTARSNNTNSQSKATGSHYVNSTSKSNSPRLTESSPERSPRSSPKLSSAAESSRSQRSDGRLSPQNDMEEMLYEYDSGQSNSTTYKQTGSPSAGSNGDKMADNMADYEGDIHL